MISMMETTTEQELLKQPFQQPSVLLNLLVSLGMSN
jgi:hypothetical protein